ncbi:MAG: M28 family peptidase [Xanthomonadales bacterium]|nr:M28 family peptidase [Xanthomonadales bacterium]
MRPLPVLLLALHAPLSLAAGLEESQLQTAAALRDQALAGSGACAIVESLTTEVGPRLAGSEADARGRAWAEVKFRELGFDRVWTEAVSFPVWERGYESAAVVAPYPQPLIVTALGGTVGTPEGGVRAEVVAFPSLDALQAADPASVAGKIVFLNQRMERARDGSGYGRAVVIRAQGASVAGRAGAAAVLIRSVGTDSTSRTPHTGMMRYDNTPTRIPAAALSNVDADLLEKILQRGEPVTVKLELGSRTRKGDYTSANVIGEITGRQAPQEVVLLAAHLDSWDLGTGAIDDGAGIAITMAAGALIGQQAQPPRRSIRVVAYANEEQGIYGGKAYAEAHADDFHNHILALESDFGAGRIYRFDTRFAEAALPLATQMQTLLTPLGVERGSNEAYGGADISTLRAAEVPVAGLAQDGTLYFDIHHTANDTLDKIDAADLDQNVAGFVTVAWLAADTEAYLDERERPAGD